MLKNGNQNEGAQMNSVQDADPKTVERFEKKLAAGKATCGICNTPICKDCGGCDCQGCDCQRAPKTPDIDDTVKSCPQCDTPNQFGELCNECRRYEEYDAMAARKEDYERFGPYQTK